MGDKIQVLLNILTSVLCQFKDCAIIIWHQAVYVLSMFTFFTSLGHGSVPQTADHHSQESTGVQFLQSVSQRHLALQGWLSVSG